MLNVLLAECRHAEYRIRTEGDIILNANMLIIIIKVLLLSCLNLYLLRQKTKPSVHISNLGTLSEEGPWRTFDMYVQ